MIEIQYEAIREKTASFMSVVYNSKYKHNYIINILCTFRWRKSKPSGIPTCSSVLTAVQATRAGARCNTPIYRVSNVAYNSRRPRSAARRNGAKFNRSVVRDAAAAAAAGVLQPGRACIAGIRSRCGGVREWSNVTWNTIPRRRPWHAWFRRRSSFLDVKNAAVARFPETVKGRSHAREFVFIII